MAQRSCIPALALFSACLFLFCHFEFTVAKDFTVGDAAGWSFDQQDWPSGKSFKAGDVLVFKYPAGAHNVAVVDEKGYNSCAAPSGGKVFTSGNDRVTLAKGTSYFICTFPGHCDSGMKIKVTAS